MFEISEKEKIVKLNKVREEKEQLDLFHDLLGNISQRAAHLESQCNIEIGDFSDEQVLDKMKNINLLDNRFNEILVRITKLVKTCQDNEGQEILQNARSIKMV